MIINLTVSEVPSGHMAVFLTLRAMLVSVGSGQDSFVLDKPGRNVANLERNSFNFYEYIFQPHAVIPRY